MDIFKTSIKLIFLLDKTLKFEKFLVFFLYYLISKENLDEKQAVTEAHKRNINIINISNINKSIINTIHINTIFLLA